jgi:hypothetical protein
MEKTIPPCPLTVAGEEEEINPQYEEIWHGETLTLWTRSTRKLIKTIDLTPSNFRQDAGGEGRRTSGGGRRRLGLVLREGDEKTYFVLE